MADERNKHKYSTYVLLVLLFLFSFTLLVEAGWTNDGTFTWEDTYEVVVNELWFWRAWDTFIDHNNNTGLYLNSNNSVYVTKYNKTVWGELKTGDIYTYNITSQHINATDIKFYKNGSMIITLDPVIGQKTPKNTWESATNGKTQISGMNTKCGVSECEIQLHICNLEDTKKNNFDVEFISTKLQPIRMFEWKEVKYTRQIPQIEYYQYIDINGTTKQGENITYIEQEFSEWQWKKLKEFIIDQQEQDKTTQVNLGKNECKNLKLITNNILGQNHKYDVNYLDPLIDSTNIYVGNVSGANQWSKDSAGSTTIAYVDSGNKTFELGTTPSALTTNMHSHHTMDDADTAAGVTNDVHAGQNGNYTGTTTGKNGILNEAFGHGGSSTFTKVPNVWTSYSQARSGCHWANRTWTGSYTEALWGTNKNGGGLIYLNLWNNIAYYQWRTAGDVGWDQLTYTMGGASGWKHFCWSYDGTNRFEFWINGTVVGNKTSSLGYRAAWGEGTYIGRRPLAGVGFTGEMDTVSIWNKTINTQEVLQHYNSHTGILYPFGGGYDVTANRFQSKNLSAALEVRNITATWQAEMRGQNVTVNVSCDQGVTWTGALVNATSTACTSTNPAIIQYEVLLSGNSTHSPRMQNLTIGLDVLQPKTAEFEIRNDAGQTLLTTDFDGTTELTLIYGDMWIHNEAGVTTTISDSTTYWTVNGFNEGLTNGITYTTNTLTTTYPGIYQVDWHLGFSGGITRVYEITTKVNGTSQGKCENHRKMNSNGDQGSTSGTCILNLGANATVRLGIQDSSGSADIDSFGGNLRLVKIGR